MSGLVAGRLAGWAERKMLTRWSRLADRAPVEDPSALKSVRSRARALQQRVDRLLHVADTRLALPMVGATGIKRPLHSDWAWRPGLWAGPVRPAGVVAAGNKTAFGPEASLHHDCRWSEITLRQIRNSSANDLAPYSLRLDVFDFDGSYLSLVIELPSAAAAGLSKNHIVGVDLRMQTERSVEVFARLNVRHGPNTEQVVREVPPGNGDRNVEFDLAYSEMNERRVERAWVDLIFERPAFNEIRIEDVTFTRRPRAGF
ncbi:MAG: DUF6478 family protein [Pseudomonadota bacterium]